MMKSGEYYIGDLCYVMHDAWNEVCDLIFPERAQRGLEGEFSLKDGRRFALYNTNHGDGTYKTDSDSVCFVDSGTIGCIMKSQIKDFSYDDEQLKNMAVFHTFDEPFQTRADIVGREKIIRFGNFNVYT